ncbi:hypothetical protein GCM10010439_37590 [Actinocorallia aurantiaca]|uniref:Uncharacterized protein n=1 Tax=Actinocorallia aurantiaca TaxID=46204 RepID=A0ABN3UC10_9ACTN
MPITGGGVPPRPEGALIGLWKSGEWLVSCEGLREEATSGGRGVRMPWRGAGKRDV